MRPSSAPGAVRIAGADADNRATSTARRRRVSSSEPYSRLSSRA
jgi:hypothetical protein